MIKAIIFDWGGVLAEADTDKAAQYLAEKYNYGVLEIKEIIKECEPQCSESNDYKLFIEQINLKYAIPEEEIKKAMLLSIKMENEKVIVKLKGRFILCILSNQMKFKTDHIKTNNDLSCFDYLFFSNEIGCQKPSVEAFKHVLAEIRVSPEECLFIDDNEKNIIAAQELRMQTIHCTNIRKLDEEIQKRKLL